LVNGCGDDDERPGEDPSGEAGAQGDAGSGGTTGGAETGGGGVETGGGGVETGGGGAEAGGGGEAESGGTAGVAGDESGDACAGIACSGHGSCRVDGQQRPRCDCDPGHLTVGLECLVCTSASVDDDLELTVEVPTASVSGSITLAGSELVPSSGRAELRLRNIVTGDNVWISGLSASSYSQIIVPGFYDLHYAPSATSEPVLPEEALPASPAVLRRDIDLTATETTLDIDIPKVTLSGQLKLEGGPTPPDSMVLVVNLETGRVGSIPLSGDFYEGPLVPGTYDVLFHQKGSDGPALGEPVTQSTLMQAGVAVEADTVLDFDAPRIEVRGSITLAGAAVDPQEEAGLLYLSNEHGAILLNPLSAGSFSRWIAPGVYDVYYMFNRVDDPPYLSTVPANQHALLLEGVDLDEDRVLDLDVPRIELSGTVRVAGALTSTADGVGELYLQPTEAGLEALLPLGRTYDATYSRFILPGEYDLVYRQLAPAEASAPNPVPNSFVVLSAGLNITQSSELDIDVPRVTISGAVSMPGGPGSDDRWFEARNPTGSALLTSLDVASYSSAIVPGIYDIYYSGSARSGVPRGHAVVASQLDLSQDTSLNLEPPLGAGITVSTAIDGERMASTFGEIWLMSETAGAVSLPISTADISFELVPGLYRIAYTNIDYNEGTLPPPPWPINEHAVVGCLEVTP
jgi:hypothetical protein